MQGRNYPDFVVKHYGTHEPYNFETLVVLPVPWSRAERVELVAQALYTRFGAAVGHVSYVSDGRYITYNVSAYEGHEPLEMGQQFHGLMTTDVKIDHLFGEAGRFTYTLKETSHDSLGQDLPPRE